MKAVIGFFVGCLTLFVIPWFCIYELIIPQKEQNGSSCEKNQNQQRKGAHTAP
jgi:hypothetical protein